MSVHAVAATEILGMRATQRQLGADERNVAAIVYDNEAYPNALFRQIVDACRKSGVAIAGVLQHLAFEGADRRCDVHLEDLSSGHRTRLFENRGSEARGCRLDGAALVEAATRIENSLDGAPGLLLLNKFGKAEAEGEGMRGLIAKAIEADIPVIIGVPVRNLDTWRDFAGDLALELPADFDRVQRWLNGARGTDDAKGTWCLTG
jgi:hypothetical protein